MIEPRNNHPIHAPAAPPILVRMLGFMLLGGTMWIAGLLALWRSVAAVIAS